ncbi:UDP-4-amino-4,6-dideoxy-N-acetyl-beta-L-altrosamine N-acetyltransferase [Pseudomonas knackmussii]|uniref:UDP-4-amino-4, 6-dideoxy-N-acetyl-beta-L-altrosamine N-acetyltransferase n=1 Tax=Pseudomonas knackmussii TaxID=65741 RepID=UPI0013634F94|nr:UDP-4-amino-4,6-dideoxy-N-acetyl-beta-L-altrosamine N-acetyltransferase [Pseudomonas knackmussii]
MECIRRLTEADLPLLLSWRNAPEVRRYMFNQHQIQLAEHIQWFARANHDPAYTLLIYELDGPPLGHMNFARKSSGAIAEWGFYIAPNAPRGTGTKMGICALRHAFGVMQLKRVSAQILGYNERSIYLHRKLGFQQEGVLRSQHFDGESYHDIHCFGLLAHEWKP